MDESLAGTTSGGADRPAGADAIQLTLSPAEAELMRTALDFLRSTLGREEADELDAVQELLARLRRAVADRPAA
jgi:hypothetical protein